MKLREDGGIAIRQSWLNDFLLCPERARRNVLEPDQNIGGTPAETLQPQANLNGTLVVTRSLSGTASGA